MACSGGDTGGTVARNINQQLDVKGGVTDPDKLSDNNIGVVANGKDALNVVQTYGKLKYDPQPLRPGTLLGRLAKRIRSYGNGNR